MTTQAFDSTIQPGSVLGALSGQQLQALVENVRAQMPAPATFDGDEGLKDHLMGRAEPTAQGVVSALGLASIVLLSEARAEQALSNLSPLRLALESLDQTLLQLEPDLVGLSAPNAPAELDALRAEASAMDWSELVASVQDLSQEVAGQVAAPDAMQATTALNQLPMVVDQMVLVDQAVGEALPVLETGLAAAGVPLTAWVEGGILGTSESIWGGDALGSIDFNDLSALGGLTDVTDGLTDTVDSVVDSVVDGVTDVVDGLLGGEGGALGGLTDVTAGLTETVDNTLDLVGDTADSLLDLVTDASGDLLDTATGVLDLGDGLLSTETGLLSGLEGDGDLVGLVSDLLGEDVSLLGDTAIVDVVTGGEVLQPVTDVLESGTDVLTNVVDVVLDDSSSLGGLTESLTQTGTEDGSLLGGLTNNLLG